MLLLAICCCLNMLMPLCSVIVVKNRKPNLQTEPKFCGFNFFLITDRAYLLETEIFLTEPNRICGYNRTPWTTCGSGSARAEWDTHEVHGLWTEARSTTANWQSACRSSTNLLPSRGWRWPCGAARTRMAIHDRSFGSFVYFKKNYILFQICHHIKFYDTYIKYYI